MTRFRIKLLITLALFAAVSATGVTLVSAAERWPDESGSPTVTTTESPRPAVRPCSGEPDLGNGNAPAKLGMRQVAPPDVEKRHHHDRGRIEWAGRIWAAWLLFLMR